MTAKLRPSTIEARHGRPLDDFADTSTTVRAGQRQRAVARTRPQAPPATVGTVWNPVSVSVGERYDLLDVWSTVFTDIYVHYDQKRALYGFDPLRALGALRRQVPYLDSAGFLRELMLLVNRLRDQHTSSTSNPTSASSLTRSRYSRSSSNRTARISPRPTLSPKSPKPTIPTSSSVPKSRHGMVSHSGEPSTSTAKR